MELQTTILRNLISNEEYTRRAIPFIKPVYFEGEHRIVFNEIAAFVQKYNKLPTQEALLIEVQDNDRVTNEALSLVNQLQPEPIDMDWLLEKSEKWCQDRAVFLAVMDSISIIDGKDKERTTNAIPEIMKEALSVCFDTNIGHDYIDNFEQRFDFYHQDVDRLPFDLEYFNKITKGGVPNKTLNIALAGTGVGKSLFMCHCAAANLLAGKNVLYISMEMAEERIAERIDANLMNLPIDQLKELPKQLFEDKVSKIAKKSQGKLIVKEYPTGAAHAGHFRALLNELKLKRDFKPDVIYIDYLNICASSRVKGMGGAINSYTYVKAIAEELRGLAVEFDVPLFSATQTTRSGFGNTDVGLEDTSESFGLPATADLMFALIATEELEQLGQLMVKQLKNRYNDPGFHKRFVVGIDRPRMKLFDVEEAAQDQVLNDAPIPDKPLNTFGNNENNNFSGFKV